MAFLRLLIFGFVGLSVIYVLVSIYARSLALENLEDRWAEDHPGDRDSAERQAYLDAGMLAYKNGLRRKLVLLVYIIPAIAVVVTLILTNAN